MAGAATLIAAKNHKIRHTTKLNPDARQEGVAHF
jgi:hypothetical protein